MNSVNGMPKLVQGTAQSFLCLCSQAVPLARGRTGQYESQLPAAGAWRVVMDANTQRVWVGVMTR